jgi:hypothetical protein
MQAGGLRNSRRGRLRYDSRAFKSLRDFVDVVQDSARHADDEDF